MRCYVDPDKISARQPDDDESVERLESGAPNHEQVHAAICVEWLRRKVSHPCEREADRPSLVRVALLVAIVKKTIRGAMSGC